jgi:hypothetical protein
LWLESGGLFAVDNRNKRPANLGSRKLRDLLGSKLHHAVAPSLERVIYADTDADASFHASTALAHDNTTITNDLTAK